TPKALEKGDRSWVDGGPLMTLCDRLVDVILCNRGADDRMDFGREILRRRHPVAQGDGHRDDPLPRRHPGDDLLDEMRRHLGHAPRGTGRAKPASLATEGHQYLLLAGVTAETEKAVRQDATPQIIVEFALDIGRQARGLWISLARGEKGLQVLCNHRIEHRMTGIPGCVGGHRWCHNSPHDQEGSKGSAINCYLIY